MLCFFLGQFDRADAHPFSGLIARDVIPKGEPLMRKAFAILILTVAASPALAIPVPVPEPASMTLLGVGLATALLVRRGKK